MWTPDAMPDAQRPTPHSSYPSSCSHPLSHTCKRYPTPLSPYPSPHLHYTPRVGLIATLIVTSLLGFWKLAPSLLGRRGSPARTDGAPLRLAIGCSTLGQGLCPFKGESL